MAFLNSIAYCIEVIKKLQKYKLNWRQLIMIEIKKNGKKVQANGKFRPKSIKLITEVDLDIAAIHGYLMLIAVIETGELILYFTEDKIGKEFDSWGNDNEYEEIKYIDSIVNDNNHSYILLDRKFTYSSIATNIANKMRIDLKNIFFKAISFRMIQVLFSHIAAHYQKNVIAKDSEDNAIKEEDHSWLPTADAGVEIEMVDKLPEPVNQSQKIKSTANNIVASNSLKFEITVNIRQIS